MLHFNFKFCLYVFNIIIEINFTADFDKEAKLLFKVSNLSSWVKSEDCLLNMINVITIILKKLTTNVNLITAKNTIKIIKQLLSATKLLLEETSMNVSYDINNIN